MSNCYAIILFGDSGTHLRLLSPSFKPKRLLSLRGNSTVIHQPAPRICQKVSASCLFTFTQARNRFEFKGQLAAILPSALNKVMVEPIAKNTLDLVRSDMHLENNYEWRDLTLVFNVININKPQFADCTWIDPYIEILSL